MKRSYRITCTGAVKTGCIAILLLCVGPVSPARAATTSIMLLGDSITKGENGSNPVGGFRDDLDGMLVGSGGEHDFVGTLNDGVGFDADHEGHGGWTVDMILADIDSFMGATNPEMILIHLGTNDISANEGVATTLVEMDSLLQRIYSYDMFMNVLLSGIIPRDDPGGPEKDSLTTELNEGYLSFVNDFQSRGFDIKYVDHNSAFRANPNWRNDFLDDHVHPNNAGYAVMAQTYYDSLANENIFDSVPPGVITDLTVESITSRTVRVSWTASGDDGYTGTSDSYDIRYSLSPITGANFPVASQSVGEPDPSPSGSQEEYTVGGLDPAETYYFAVKAVDEAGNPSPVSNVASAGTATNHALLDDYERTELGTNWNADPEFIISNGELANSSLEERWDFIAVYNPVTNAETISLRWGTNADTVGIGDGGLAVMMDSPSPDANGYLIFRHRNFNYYALWTISNGMTGISVAQSPQSSLPFPQAGDIFDVVVSTDSHGHHFDCYINGVYDTRVSDIYRFQGNGSDLWAGVMLYGNRNNNIEDFWVRGMNVNLPPGPFNLASPPDGSTVESGEPLLDWYDSIDPNLSDSVLYTLYYGMSAIFSPESTTVVNDISESEYAIPPLDILSLARGEGISLSSLPDDVVVYWKVKALDADDLETWSEELDWSFTVSIPDPPLPFSLLSPVDGDTVGTRTPTLSWEATSDPDSGDVITYTVYYDTNPGFLSQIVIPGLEGTTYSTPLLDDNTHYYWKVDAVDSKDLVTESNEVFSFYVSSQTGIGNGRGGDPGLPKVFSMSQNYPNPFNPSTSIRFGVPVGVDPEGAVKVLLQVFNLRGQLVRTLEDGERTAGSYVVHWNGRNENGEKVGSGIYIYRIQAGTFGAIRKMVMLK